MKALTEKQAWSKIARAFERYHKTGAVCALNVYGLCWAVMELECDERITSDCSNSMDDKIDAHGHKIHVRDTDHFFPKDQKHAKHRAALARRFAKACE
jgi:hypothetical protein